MGAIRTKFVLIASWMAIVPSMAFVEPALTPHRARNTSQLYLMDFLKQGKQALVKSLAGDYDSVAVRERLDGLIADNKVLMLSFTT